ncbi:MAG: hypothetical protein ACE5I1_08775 [bacterium]
MIFSPGILLCATGVFAQTQMGRALKFLRKRLIHFLLAFPL